MTTLLFAAAAIVAAYALLGNLMDSVVFPEAEPGPDFFPPVGHVFASKSEGFHQTVLKRANGLLWIELELEPHAAGPPEHVHTTFAENFLVTEGTLTVLVNGEKRVLHPGESLLVPPGTPHKPFNETASRVIVGGPLDPSYALPDLFGVFLTQAYGFFDSSPSNAVPPKALLQMSRFSPKYDSWLASPPVPMQRALFFLLRPAARLLGYRTHYDSYRPHSNSSSSTLRVERQLH